MAFPGDACNRVDVLRKQCLTHVFAGMLFFFKNCVCSVCSLFYSLFATERGRTLRQVLFKCVCARVGVSHRAGCTLTGTLLCLCRVPRRTSLHHREQDSKTQGGVVSSVLILPRWNGLLFDDVATRRNCRLCNGNGQRRSCPSSMAWPKPDVVDEVVDDEDVEKWRTPSKTVISVILLLFARAPV